MSIETQQQLLVPIVAIAWLWALFVGVYICRELDYRAHQVERKRREKLSSAWQAGEKREQPTADELQQAMDDLVRAATLATERANELERVDNLPLWKTCPHPWHGKPSFGSACPDCGIDGGTLCMLQEEEEEEEEEPMPTQLTILEVLTLPPKTVSFPAGWSGVDFACEGAEERGWTTHRHADPAGATTVFMSEDVYQEFAEAHPHVKHQFFPRLHEQN